MHRCKNVPLTIDNLCKESLLFICSGDEECVDSCVLVMSDLDDELWDSQPDVVQ